jgi:2'-5' RNA ligase
MRLFLALELPEAVARAVAELRERLRLQLRGWRWVSPHGMHVTVRFLGEVDEARDLASREAWRSAAATVPAFEIRATALGRFPERGRPRVLWVGVEETAAGGALASLAVSLEVAARACGWPAEPRPFRPHLTLARAARDGTPDAAGPDQGPGAAVGRVHRVVLFQSHLGPRGARYTALASFPLAARPAVADNGGLT